MRQDDATGYCGARPVGFDAVRSGDETALAELYRALNPRLLRYLAAHAAPVADDLAQEVWLTASRRLAQFEGDENDFRAWLFTIARRRLIDYWRTRGRHPTAPLNHRDLVGAAHEPADRLVIQAAVAELIADLSPDQAEIVMLRVVGGLPVDEVASIVDKSPGAVRVIQHRALRLLAGRMNERAVTPTTAPTIESSR